MQCNCKNDKVVMECNECKTYMRLCVKCKKTKTIKCPDFDKEHKFCCDKYQTSSTRGKIYYDDDYVGTCICRYVGEPGCIMLCAYCGPTKQRFIKCRCGQYFENTLSLYSGAKL